MAKYIDIESLLERTFNGDMPVKEVINGQYYFFFADGTRYVLNETEYNFVLQNVKKILQNIEEQISLIKDDDDNIKFDWKNI